MARTVGYALEQALHVSGPIAMAVAGMLTGNHGRILAMTSMTVEHLGLFWELIDEADRGQSPIKLDNKS